MLACCRQAKRLGVRPGMPLSEATSISRHNLHFEPHDAHADAVALRRLAVLCEKFSPVVGIEEGDAPECLLLDVTGLGHLFGSEEQLVRQIVRELSHRRYTVRVAVADTVGAAWAAAHFLVASRASLVLPRGRAEVLFDLPIEGLRLSPKTTALLHQLGMEWIGQVVRLPPSSLKARFGQEILKRLDQLTGRRPETIVPHRPSPAFKERWASELSTTSNEVVEQVLSHLLDRLSAKIRARQQGIVTLECVFDLEHAESLSVPLALYQPTNDPKHLFELVRLQLERQQLPGPVSGIVVEAKATAPLVWKQQELFTHHRQENSKALAMLVDRLSSRLGRDAVHRPRLRSDAVPEHAYSYIPLSGRNKTRRQSRRPRFAPFERPLCLLPSPVPVKVIATVPDGPPAVLFYRNARQELVHVWGPERIETAWWRGPTVRRDYYHVETSTGHRYWLFRRLQDMQWFLHGEFD